MTGLDETLRTLQEQFQLVATQVRHAIPYPVQAYFETQMSSLPQAINQILLVMLGCNFLFFLGSCNVYHLPNIGSSTVLVSFASVAHNVALWVVFNNPDHQRFHLTNSEFTIGLMVGLCVGISGVLFVTCHYFGQMMKCTSVDDDVKIKQYLCESKGAMWTIWFFGSVMLMLNMALVVLIKGGRHELTSGGTSMAMGPGGGGYEEVGGDDLRFEGDFPQHSSGTGTGTASGKNVTTLHV